MDYIYLRIPLPDGMLMDRDYLEETVEMDNQQSLRWTARWRMREENNQGRLRVFPVFFLRNSLFFELRRRNKTYWNKSSITIWFAIKLL